jgi:hypothetical protein
VSVKSLIATISKSREKAASLKAARAKQRPMRPKPLIAIFFAIFNHLFFEF